MLGIGFVAAGMEGHLWVVGRVSLWSRPLFVGAGLLIAFPEGTATIIGIILLLVAVLITSAKKILYGNFVAKVLRNRGKYRACL